MKKKKNNSIKVYHYDPVCRKKINKNKASYIYNFKNEQFLICCPVCQSEFESNRKKYMDAARRLDDKTNKQRA